ncbi:MAG: TonB-dependent receptor [Alphaproteobacteria bacterium]|nr:MAG: TonB-dependent receptor [Alphaproteobacteria bacterium]
MREERNIYTLGRLLMTTALSGVTGLLFSTIGQSAEPIFEEIIITAQKRDQNLQDVPISVTAFSGAAMKALNLVNSVDIAGQTPGLNIGTPVGEGNNASITLRGVGLNDFNDNNEAPVAVYIDEVYQGALAGQTFQLFDMERVEVLRGPQGTLYGRNSTGGLVHFVTRKPSEETELYGDITYGSNNQVKFEGAVGGALGEKVQGRLSFATNHYDGYVKNRAGPDHNEAENYALRAQLNFDMTDKLSALVSVNWAKSDVISPAYQHQATGLDAGGVPCDPSTEAGLAGCATDFFGYADNDGDNFAGAYDTDGFLKLKTYGGSLKLSAEISEGIDLVSISAFGKVEKDHQEDTDMSPVGFFKVSPIFRTRTKQFTQEVRLSGGSDNMKWVTGAYYFYQNVDAEQDLIFGDFAPGFFLDTKVDQITNSLGFFAQTEYDVSDQLTFVLGGRWTKDKKDYHYTQVDKLGGVAGVPPGTVLLDFSEDSFGDLAKIDTGVFSGKAGLNWTPNEDTLVFVSVSRGFKSGGFNSGFSSAGPDEIKYDEEKITSYEIGLKASFADNRLRFNATAFYYDYKDLQALTFKGTSSFITNASDATIKGFELELQGNPLDGLDINFGMSILDTNADGIAIPDGAGGIEVLADRKLVLAPEFSANGLIRYGFEIGNGGELSAQVDFNYQGEHFFDIKNQFVSQEDGYWVWNARLAYQLPDNNMELSVFVKNFTKSNYKVYTFDFTGDFGFNQQFYGPPRWFGVRFSISN